MNPVSVLRRIVALSRTSIPLQGYWIALVRFALGIFFCISGATKLFDAAGRAEMVETLIASGVPFPEANAFFVSGVEFVGGGYLAIGLLTPICAVLLGGDMLVAILTDRIKSVHGDTFFAWLDNLLYLPEVMYVLILGWLLISGAGKFSLDGLLAPEESASD